MWKKKTTKTLYETKTSFGDIYRFVIFFPRCVTTLMFSSLSFSSLSSFFLNVKLLWKLVAFFSPGFAIAILGWSGTAQVSRVAWFLMDPADIGREQGDGPEADFPLFPQDCKGFHIPSFCDPRGAVWTLSDTGIQSAMVRAEARFDMSESTETQDMPWDLRAMDQWLIPS